ncbi:4385_t:CDS:2, partial [Dentiscutata heterogama]
GFFTALVLCACVTSISELDVEELLELLSEVSELEEAFVEYLILFFLLLFLETSSFNLLNSRYVEARPGLDSINLDKLFLVELALLKSSLNNEMLIPSITILACGYGFWENIQSLFLLHISITNLAPTLDRIIDFCEFENHHQLNLLIRDQIQAYRISTMTENNNIELVLKQQNVIDSCSECPIITYKIAKKLGFEKDKSLPITDKVVFDIVKQVSSKKIQISLCQLLKIVKLEIQQDIINSIANPDISWRNCTLFEAKRKKTIFNNIASESSSKSSSLSESGSNSEWNKSN